MWLILLAKYYDGKFFFRKLKGPRPLLRILLAEQEEYKLQTKERQTETTELYRAKQSSFKKQRKQRIKLTPWSIIAAGSIGHKLQTDLLSPLGRHKFCFFKKINLALLNANLIIIENKLIPCLLDCPTHKDDSYHEELTVHLIFDGHYIFKSSSCLNYIQI